MNQTKTSYCSLKDAFKVPSFTKEMDIPEIEYKNEEISPVLVENFNEVSCKTVEEHCIKCSKCKKLNRVDVVFNDILNILLILFLLWVIIYKPSI